MSSSWSKGSEPRWRRFRAAILKRDKYLCQIAARGCTITAPLTGGHVDHIIPLEMGGQKYDPENCRAACRNCNLTRKKTGLYYEPPIKKVSSW